MTTQTSNVPPVPYNTPIIGANGLLTMPWVAWFRQVFNRVGGGSGSGGGFLLNPMTALGDMISGGASGTPARLAGNITTTKKFLAQVGSGSVSASPAWAVVSLSDLPLIPLTSLTSGSNAAGEVPTSDGLGDVIWGQGVGYSVQGTRSSPISITAAGGISSTTNPRQLIRAQGSGGPVTITANPSISPGTIDGQELVIEGCDNTATLTIPTGNGVEQDADAVLGRGFKVAYLWENDPGVWSKAWQFPSSGNFDPLTDDSGNELTDDSGNPLSA